jgi:hypothetical protein
MRWFGRRLIVIALSTKWLNRRFAKMDGMVDMYGGISWRSAPSNFERHCRIPEGFHFSTHVSQGPLLREELTFSHMIDSEPFPTMITSLLRPAEGSNAGRFTVLLDRILAYSPSRPYREVDLKHLLRTVSRLLDETPEEYQVPRSSQVIFPAVVLISPQTTNLSVVAIRDPPTAQSTDC